jgi:hypothetical protein
MSADLSALDLVALMLDGIRVAEHTCVVALGITLDGTKVPLALAEAPPRTPPWWVICWPTYATADSTRPGRCWW